jgi:hypothetical protein
MGKALKALTNNKQVTFYQTYQIVEGLEKLKEKTLESETEIEVFSIIEV